MKTNKLPSKKHRFEVWLTITGWVLAVFVSLLYLSDIRMDKQVPSPPKMTVTPSAAQQSARVTELLLDAESYLEKEQPEAAINRVTTLWSVCHSTQQPVPEESHQLFAKAVSDLSERKRPPRRPLVYPGFKTKDLRAEHLEASVAPPMPPKPRAKSEKKATFELPEGDYPRAGKKAPSMAAPDLPPPPRADRADDVPPPPPPYQAQMRLPAPPSFPSSGRGNVRNRNRGGRALPPGFPAPPARNRNPLDMRDAGAPQGY